MSYPAFKCTPAPSSTAQSQTDGDCSLGIQMVLFILEYALHRVSNRESSFHDPLFSCSLRRSTDVMLCRYLKNGTTTALSYFAAGFQSKCEDVLQQVLVDHYFPSVKAHRFYLKGNVICCSLVPLPMASIIFCNAC